MYKHVSFVDSTLRIVWPSPKRHLEPRDSLNQNFGPQAGPELARLLLASGKISKVIVKVPSDTSRFREIISNSRMFMYLAEGSQLIIYEKFTARKIAPLTTQSECRLPQIERVYPDGKFFHPLGDRLSRHQRELELSKMIVRFDPLSCTEFTKQRLQARLTAQLEGVHDDHPHSFLNPDPYGDIRSYLSNPDLTVRVVVDMLRPGIGHQGAAITGINRLYELGFKGKLEITVPDANPGRDVFLSLLPGLINAAELPLPLSPDDMSKPTIQLGQNIVIRSVLFLNSIPFYLDTFQRLSHVDLCVIPASDVNVRFADLNAHSAIRTNPTGFVIGEPDKFLTRDGVVTYPSLADDGVLMSRYVPSEHPEINPLIAAKKAQHLFYMNVYGREQTLSTQEIVWCLLDVARVKISKEQKPCVIFIHKHRNNSAKLTLPGDYYVTSFENFQKRPLSTFSIDRPVIVHVESLHKDLFEALLFHSDLVVAESANTYQQCLLKAHPFIHGFGTGFSINKLPEGLLSAEVAEFESRYLAAQSHLERSCSGVQLEQTKALLLEVVEKSSASTAYFKALSEHYANRLDKVAILLNGLIEYHKNAQSPCVRTSEFERDLFNATTSILRCIQALPDLCTQEYRQMTPDEFYRAFQSGRIPDDPNSIKFIQALIAAKSPASYQFYPYLNESADPQEDYILIGG